MAAVLVEIKVSRHTQVEDMRRKDMDTRTKVRQLDWTGLLLDPDWFCSGAGTNLEQT